MRALPSHRARFSSGWAWVVALAMAALGVGGASGCGMGDDEGSQNNANQNNNQTWPDGGVQCQYSVTVDPLAPVVNETVTLRVEWVGSDCAPDPQDGYAWTVRGPEQDPITPTLRQQGRIAELTPTRSGTYTIEVAVNDLYQSQPVLLSRSVSVSDPAGMQRTFVLRLTPPLQTDLPRQQQILVVTGGTPLSERMVSLDEGVLVSNTLQGPTGPVGGYLRFVQQGFQLYREVRVPSSGAFQLAMLSGALYDVVIIPDGAEPAPVLLQGYGVPTLLDSQTFQLDAGEAVVGYVVDAQESGVGGARVGLRSSGLPSGVGTTDPYDGRFVLRARPGPQAFEVAPAAGCGLPTVRVPQGAGIELQAGVALGLRLKYSLGAPQTPELVVRAGPAGQGAPVADARVTLEATDLGPVGTVTVTRDGSPVATLDASGIHRVTAVTDAQGRLPAVSLPAGRYRAVVEPPAGATPGYGTTVIEELVIGGGAPASQVLSLAPPTLLQGWVIDDLDSPVEDVRVVAITRAGVGSATETFTDTAGYFSLEVVAGARYEVRLSPPAGGRALARRVLPAVTPAAPSHLLQGAGPAGELVLPAGLSVSGQVLFQSGGLGGVLVQAIPSDLPGEPVLAETVTDLNGAFTLVMPDPGVSP
jgi:hypothetical protein